MTDPDAPIDNPNWEDHIRHFFTDDDIYEMGPGHRPPFNMKLDDYEEVKALSGKLFSRVADGTMPPPDTGMTWSPERVKNFDTWRRNGCPQNADSPIEDYIVEYENPGAPRLRKEIRQLSEEETEKLIKAFTRIVNLPSDDPNSFFAHAAIHYYPAPAYCHHHATLFFPWHRTQILCLENAMRTIDGCEDVTLPYWDFENLEELPELLFKEPFSEYKLPENIKPDAETGSGYAEGDSVGPPPAEEIIKTHLEWDILGDLENGMSEDTWAGFNSFLEDGFNGVIAAHDNGHRFLGAPFGATSFSPLFWFFHCNWDRLWWKWQNNFGATTLETFLPLVEEDSREVFTDDVIGALEPYTNSPAPTAQSTIDSLGTLGVGYTSPDLTRVRSRKRRGMGSSKAGDTNVFDGTKVSVRIKGLDRVSIPGSFDLHLKADGETIAKRGVAQPDDPLGCPNCVENRRVTFDFVVPLEAVHGKALSVDVRMWPGESTDKDTSLSAVGDPTIQVRLLTMRQTGR